MVPIIAEAKKAAIRWFGTRRLSLFAACPSTPPPPPPTEEARRASSPAASMSENSHEPMESEPLPPSISSATRRASRSAVGDAVERGSARGEAAADVGNRTNPPLLMGALSPSCVCWPVKLPSSGCSTGRRTARRLSGDRRPRSAAPTPFR